MFCGEERLSWEDCTSGGSDDDSEGKGSSSILAGVGAEMDGSTDVGAG